jgi:3-oxoacyl-[acyl-carrier protein] reductase
LLDLPAELFEETIRFNLLSPFHWARAVWHASMARAGGTIINISSTSGLQPVRAMGGYSVGKAALNALTQVLAGELGPGVRVNCIAPGLTRTDATAGFTDRPDLAGAVPLGRVGEATDLSAAALFLASAEAGWITGQVLAVDGGIVVGNRQLRGKEA